MMRILMNVLLPLLIVGVGVGAKLDSKTSDSASTFSGLSVCSTGSRSDVCSSRLPESATR